MKILTVKEFGIIDKTDRPVKKLPPNKIRVKVKYAGVGFADVMAVRGGYALAPKRPFSPGYEFYGTVIEAGSEVKNFSIDCRVAGMLPEMEAYCEYLDIDPKWAVSVPSQLSDEAAGILPLNYITAMAMIQKKAKLKSGQSILIHGAAGGVGTAVLEIAKMMNVQCFGTASKEKHIVIEELGGIPVDYKNNDWLEELKKLKPEGVDAAFDAFGGESLKRSWKALAPGGSLVSYGFSPTVNGGIGPMLKGLLLLGIRTFMPNGKKAVLCGAPGIISKDPQWYRKSLNVILKWAEEGKINPRLHDIFSWDKVEQAHMEIVNRNVRGKLLLDFS